MIAAWGFVAAGAGADLPVWTGDIYQVHITDPVPVGAAPGGENLVGFTLKIVNISGDPGYDPYIFDGASYGRTGFTTETPLLHNQYLVMVGTSPTLDDPDFVTDIDTHFNFLLADVTVIGQAPAETNLIGMPTAEPFNAIGPWAPWAQTDFGDRLYGDFSIDGGAGADIDGDGDPSVWQLAYFAIPANSDWRWGWGASGGGISMNFYVGGAAGGEMVGIPEPATMSLLAIGTAGLLRRRRR